MSLNKIKEQKHWVILGAGPAGLTAAYELVKKGKPIILFEKREFLGGASATLYKDGFAYDFGPHAYHIKGDKIDLLIEEMADETLIRKNINQKLIIEDEVIGYPLKFWELMRSIHPLHSLRMVFDYVASNIIYTFIRVPEENFETWGIKKFGYSLYNLCFGQYSKRTWGISPTQLSKTLAISKLHKLNLLDIILKLFGFVGQEQVTHWKNFYYPENGIGEIWKNMNEKIQELGGVIHVGSPIVSLQAGNNRIESITVLKDGVEIIYPIEKLICTIPVGKLSSMVRGQNQDRFHDLGKKLKYVSLITVNLVFDTDRCQESHWVYLVDSRFRFNRLTEQKNLGKKCAPDGKTTVTLELTYYDEDDPMQFANDDFLERIALKEIDKISEVIPTIRREKHCSTEILRMENVYPMYTIGFENILNDLIREYAQLENMILTGRHGLFLNIDMHDTMEMSQKAAFYLMEGHTSSTQWYEMVKEYFSFKMPKGEETNKMNRMSEPNSFLVKK